MEADEGGQSGMQLDSWVPLLEADIIEHKKSGPEGPIPHYTDGQTGQGHIQDQRM